jgi:hypothetical protein
MGECDYPQEQELFLYKLLGQNSSRKCGGVSAEIGSPIFHLGGRTNGARLRQRLLTTVAAAERQFRLNPKEVEFVITF